jgi:phosphopentomutase
MMSGRGLDVVSVGKIASIFDYRGVTRSLPAHDNGEAIHETLLALADTPAGLIFTNLVDFDMLWGHRNDSRGYARGLAEFDRRLPDILGALRDDDLLIITADHGCDPTTQGSDHSREYVPILASSPRIQGGIDLGTRATLADMGQTVARNFDLMLSAGDSFLADLR